MNVSSMCAALVGVIAFAGAAPAGVIVQSNSVGYSGTWQQYGTREAAELGVGATASGSSSGVFSFDVFRGITGGSQAGPDSVLISATTPYTGYFQYANDADPNATTTGVWLNAQRTAFELTVSGGATSPSTVVGSDGLPVVQKFEADLSPSSGNFLAFALTAQFGGIGSSGTYGNGGETLFTGAGFTSVTGSVSGLFENLTNNNFYRFNFALTGPVSGQPPLPSGAVPFASDSFAAATAVPEPVAMLSFGALSVAALVARGRRRTPTGG